MMESVAKMVHSDQVQKTKRARDDVISVKSDLYDVIITQNATTKLATDVIRPKNTVKKSPISVGDFFGGRKLAIYRVQAEKQKKSHKMFGSFLKPLK